MIVNNYYRDNDEDELADIVEVDTSRGVLLKFVLTGFFLVAIAGGLYFYQFGKAHNFFELSNVQTVEATDINADFQKRRAARLKQQKIDKLKQQLAELEGKSE